MFYLSGIQAASPLTQIGAGISVPTGIVVQAANQQIAYKFWTDQAMTVNAADFYLVPTGTVTGITIQAHIETDGGNVPSGTTVGAATPAFACPTVTGPVGLKTFATPATLSAGTPYWLVLTDGGGTAPTASNFYQARYSGNYLNGGYMRQYNGTNWTTTTIVTGMGAFILQDSASAYHGLMVTQAGTQSSIVKVFGTNYGGFRTKFGVQTKVYGVIASVRMNGTPPGALEFIVTQDGGTALAVSGSIASSSFQSNSIVVISFPTPIILPANVNVYCLMHQVGSVGSSANYYGVNSNFPNTTYITAMTAGNWQTVYGSLASNNADPSTLTLQNEIPLMNFYDMSGATDFISGGSGLFIQ